MSQIVPYWGSLAERKLLRHDWNNKQTYTKDATFHVLITSYQMVSNSIFYSFSAILNLLKVVQDEKYFQRVNWQYMVLDEAQAIKSSARQRSCSQIPLG